MIRMIPITIKMAPAAYLIKRSGNRFPTTFPTPIAMASAIIIPRLLPTQIAVKVLPGWLASVRVRKVDLSPNSANTKAAITVNNGPNRAFGFSSSSSSGSLSDQSPKIMNEIPPSKYSQKRGNA